MLCFRPDGGDLLEGGGPARGIRLPVFSLPPLGGDPRQPLPTMAQSLAAGQPPPGGAPLLDPTDLTNKLEGMLGLATYPAKAPHLFAYMHTKLYQGAHTVSRTLTRRLIFQARQISLGTSGASETCIFVVQEKLVK